MSTATQRPMTPQPVVEERGRAENGRPPVARPRVRRGQARATDERGAVEELYQLVAQPDMALVVFFCSSDYDVDVVGAEMAARFAGVAVVGCTTAGEIGPVGSLDHSISAASFPMDTFAAATGHIDDLEHFDLEGAQLLTQQLLQRLEQLDPRADASNTFAFAMIDGMSVREEPVARALQTALGDVPLVGGSAGDGERFATTGVYVDGAFRSDSAVVVVVTTPLPFRTFKIQHFAPTDERVVVTSADSARRIVHEIDGWPAAEAYARLIGADIDRLDPIRFAAQPVVVVIDGTNYVRSIQKANSDGSLTFFCAIEEGLVLRAARGVDLVENLEAALANLRADLGSFEVILGCDCILRKLEIRQKGLVERVERAFLADKMVGFNGYGEVYHGVHVNQTLTGIAIGAGTDG